jgi:hypothetical protein
LFVSDCSDFIEDPFGKGRNLKPEFDQAKHAQIYYVSPYGLEPTFDTQVIRLATTLKAQRNYEKYLGRMLSKEISKKTIGFKVKGFYHSNHYVRTGTTIVLKPEGDYFNRFPNVPSRIFINHMHHTFPEHGGYVVG